MKRRVSLQIRSLLLCAMVLWMTSCATAGTALPAPTASGPLPSPKPAFTGLPLPATLPAPLPTATRSAGTPGALTLLYTNDTRGYVDPCG